LELDAQAKISQPALDKLILYTGADTDVLDKEIQKLVNFSAGKMIAEKDVEELVKADLDNNIFATIDALGRNDKKLALQLLHRHLEKGDDPFYIFSMFVYQFRNLLKVADFKEKGILDERQISQMAKLHPYVVKKSLAQVRNLSFQKLKKIYQKLGEIDFQAKTGKIDIKLALDKFVAEL
jgi:DNA polymerase-3 subunit delta